MVPNEISISDVLTSKTNAFVQNFMEVRPINPTDQVPELRDTIDYRANNAMKTALSTPSPLTLHTGCEPCALSRVGGEGGRAGPLLYLPLISPMSVISSSTLEEPLPPSATNLCGVPKSSKMCGNQQNCSSSSSNSAQICPKTQKVNYSCKWSPRRSHTPEDIPVAAMYKARWGIMAELRLRGGGETATATSGWNNNNTNNTTPAYGQSSNSSVPTSQAAVQWNNNSQPTQQPPSTGNTGVKPNNNTTSASQAPSTSQAQTLQTTQPAANNSTPQTNGQAAGQPPTQNGNSSGGNGGSTWAQAAGKGLPAASQTPATPAPTSTSTKQQLEQLNNMREALFSQDGWGAHVNQDNGWDIPSSPEPGQKDSNGATMPPVWKPNVNNEEELST